jgi:hypothetical protein
MMQYLAASAIFKNEALYLEEWLRFHELVGVEHFYLYNNDSTDDYQYVLRPWINAGKVTLHNITGVAAQREAVRHCLQNYQTACTWLALVDLDEFLFSPKVQDLRILLRPFEGEPAVAANWAMYGANGHQRRPAGLVTRNFTRRCATDLVTFEPALLKGPDPKLAANYYPVCSHVKCVVNPREVVRGLSPHHYAYRNERRAVMVWGERVAGPWSERVAIDRLRVNHYFSRSWDELAVKLQRGRADNGGQYDFQAMTERNKLFDAVEDGAILYVTGQVEADMGVRPKPLILNASTEPHTQFNFHQ